MAWKRTGDTATVRAESDPVVQSETRAENRQRDSASVNGVVRADYETDSTTTIDGVEHWANGNVTSESKNKIRLILDLYARSKDREFASITKRWDIDWFWKVDTTGPEHDPLCNRKEFYALNLVDAETEQQLWAHL